MSGKRIEVREARRLAEAALVAAGASSESAAVTARALVAAEVDGQPGHGLSRVASYALQLRAGKVDGKAHPVVTATAPAALGIDARNGFAYPAIELAIARLVPMARASGIAAAGIRGSHHFGQAGRHVERLADEGLIAIACANSPRAMAFHGGCRPMLGTNPIAFAAPVAGRPPLVVDMALSAGARARIIAAKTSGQPIPPGWAVDADGQPTTDAAAALDGALLPVGGAKGSALALMVEILVGALAGGAYGWEASSLFDGNGGPPRLGHLLIAISPEAFGHTGFAARMDALLAAVAGEAPARLPGDKRLEGRMRAATAGIEIPASLYAELCELSGTTAAA